MKVRVLLVVNLKFVYKAVVAQKVRAVSDFVLQKVNEVLFMFININCRFVIRCHFCTNPRLTKKFLGIFPYHPTCIEACDLQCCDFAVRYPRPIYAMKGQEDKMDYGKIDYDEALSQIGCNSFAEALCLNNNTIEGLIEALEGMSADGNDCKNWGITPTQWRKQIAQALRVMIAEYTVDSLKRGD